jgi:hypothetical protein
MDFNMISNTFLTTQDRKRYDAQFKVMLRTCQDNLLTLCNDRYPETIEGVLKENPTAHNPAKLVELNKAINAQSTRIEDLLIEINPRLLQ